MTRSTKRAIPLLLAIGLLALPACNIAGTAAYILEGPPKIPAQTKLDDDRATVLFIDDRSSVVPRRSLRVIMGQQAEEDMIANRVIDADKMIAAQSTLRAAMTEDADEPMSVADLGRAVGAEVVVYVSIDAWTLTRDGASYSPTVAARVKVIDAESRARIWPDTERGFPFRVQPQTSPTDIPSSSSERAGAEADLAKRVGRTIAKLFYESARDSVRDG